MKVFKVQGPKPKVQSGAGTSRTFGGLARLALRLGLRPSSLGDRDGVALVVTLIMLSIITFMAVTFLVLSQRERSSVTTAMDQKTARNATDAAFARVSAELLTRMVLHTNYQDFDLMVSTNYINQDGLNPSLLLNLNPTNVNYDYLDGGTFNPIVNPQYRYIIIASLLYNPRPPVYVTTNSGTGASEFRYYLDLNRNGRFDKNGSWPVVVVDNTGKPSYVSTNAAGQTILVATNLPIATGTYLMTNYFVGDPEWIGVLERPEELHSADNHFIARYAYLVIPAGKTLDINTIHNQAKTKSLVAGSDGYFRNQGVGPWEMNLASFLVDLNTNMWDANPNTPALYYQYNEGDLGSPLYPSFNKGLAFQDALSILAYRYNNNYGNLSTVNQLFRFPATIAADNIDEYSDGPLMTNTTLMSETVVPPADPVAQSWSGAENPTHLFSQQDIFSRLPASFAAELSSLGRSNDSYNAYTFYRLLAQLGTDSAGDQGKMNINWKNTDFKGTVLPGAETNMNAWTPLDFFTNAAAAMFQQMNMRDMNGNLVTVTNIPIYENPLIPGFTNRNYYTPAVHRVLQLAANMCDATVTNRFFGAGPTNYPSVFRPIFSSHGGIVYISGYTEVNGSAEAFLNTFDASLIATGSQTDSTNENIYGVPWVIAARKGFPNFNEFSMENPLTVSRKLSFTNSTGLGPASGNYWTTNQIFDFAITNSFGLEAWNSYTNLYGRPLRLIASNELSILLTNESGAILLDATNLPYGVDLNYPSWAGWSARALSDSSFQVPLYAASVFTNGIYDRIPPFFHPLAPPFWTSTFVPHLWMNVNFKLRFILIDTAANRVVDFVNIASTQPAVDLGYMLNNNNPFTGHWARNIGTEDGEWNTNQINGTTLQMGILNQIEVSKADAPNIWTDPQRVISGPLFNRRLLNGGTNYFEAPYTPHRTIVQRISFQANDPLVHYTAPDLISTNQNMINYNLLALAPVSGPPLANLTNLNIAYQPWGGRHLPPIGSSQNGTAFDMDWRVKDPSVQQSDNWDFPTNKLPNIGWLGRIHRGTPWQTVYMKPSTLTPDEWRNWSGDNVIITNGNTLFVDAPNTRPTDDYRLFDLFTSSLNPNASLGRLNVNQTNLAAWSAVLAGVNVLSNGPVGTVSMAIPPAGVYDFANPTPVAAIVQGITATRLGTNAFNTTVFPNQSFQHAGDVLATPQLTIASPFLNTNGLAGVTAGGINDEIMERIPQQIMSLLTLNQQPRFVIYSFGQTLHPADHSLVVGGAFNGLCTNYQITAETATRAVVRVEGTSDPKFVKGKVDSQGRSYPPHLVVEQFNVLGPD